jgi:Ras-related protein Rab-21
MTEDLVIIVAANKLDLAHTRREVSFDDAQKYITRVLGPETVLYEVSAKEDDGKLVVHAKTDAEKLTIHN